MENLIVFGGKGGVGKSSISTATAVYLAKNQPNKKILLISFDIAHNLSDLFSQEIGNAITQITPNLYAIEPDPDKYAKRYVGELEKKTHKLVKSSIILSSIPEIRDFITSSFRSENLPLALKNGLFFQSIVDAENPMENIDNTLEFNPLSKEDGNVVPSFDIIVADFPPTGNMLALFEVPMDPSQQFLRFSLELGSGLQKYVNKFKKIGTLLNPAKWILKKGLNISDQREEEDQKNKEERENLARDILDIVKKLDKRSERINQIFKEIGSLRLVSIAEKPSYEEAKRARELSEPFINVEAIHINRLIPEEEKGNSKYLDNLLQTQEKYQQKIHEDFSDIATFDSHLLDTEPIGLKGLYKLAEEVYKDIPITKILQPIEKKNKEDDGDYF